MSKVSTIDKKTGFITEDGKTKMGIVELAFHT